MRVRLSRPLGFIALAAILVGCGATVVCDEPQPVPLFFVQSATDGKTGAAVGEITLSAFTLEGEEVPAEQIFELDATYGVYVDSSAEVLGDTVLCTAPCGFGYSAPEGSYTFTVSAQGYTPEPLAVEASYKRVPPGPCGSGRVTLMNFDFVLRSS